MNEDEARQKIRTAYNKLRTYRGDDDELVKLSSSTINQHVESIRRAGDGEWKKAIAKEYIRHFEEQVEEEIEESAPAFRRESAEDAITAEATDDPSRELGVSRRELRDELDRFDADDVNDSEDMREYIEDADDVAGEDERYRYRD
jgi:hypothetical protein